MNSRLISCNEFFYESDAYVEWKKVRKPEYVRQGITK